MELSELKGDWALVTGASSGIGGEFCRQLAAAEMNLVMVARRKQRMEELSRELSTQYAIKTLVLATDLSLPNAAAKVKSAVTRAGIHIRLLCNNAAFGPWGRFGNTSAETYESVITLVSVTPISLCRLFLPDLTSFPSSVIINVSSPAALQPVPYKAVYSAAKSCLHNFSLALYGELKERGILVQTLIPGPTKSELDEKGKAYKCSLTEERRPPSEVVSASLSSLKDLRPVVSTNRGTYKQRLFAGFFPYRFVVRTVARMFMPPDAGKQGETHSKL